MKLANFDGSSARDHRFATPFKRFFHARCFENPESGHMLLVLKIRTLADLDTILRSSQGSSSVGSVESADEYPDARFDHLVIELINSTAGCGILRCGRIVVIAMMDGN